MPFLYPLLGLLVAANLTAATSYFPLKDVRPGMKATGKTVFSGSRVQEFDVEILGVLENVGPRQSLILGRLSGGPLQKTGVMQGMSGSPVYIDGRLAGAVAMAFAYSTEPIAGIRPIEEMLRVQDAALPRMQRAQNSPWDKELALGTAPPESVGSGETRLVNIATPVSFGGFSARAIETFSSQLRAVGLEPRQGMNGGGRLKPNLGNPAALEPGSMITVQLMSGDMSVGADGTVTHVDGNRILAFGHRFLSIGATEMPFARSEVITLLPNLSTSFKISQAREWMGSITEDRNTAVAGEIGRPAAMVPLSISLVRHTPAGTPGQRFDYKMEMVNDRVLTPFMLQMAIFSALDATEQSLGSSSFAVRGQIGFRNGTAPVRLDNVYAGEQNLPAQVSMGTAVPLAYIMQSGFDVLQLKDISIRIDAFDRKRQLQIDEVWTSRREVRPGEEVELTAVLSGENGFEMTRTARYRVPIGAPAGPLFLTVADANTINITEYRQWIVSPPKSAAQLVSFMNGLRPNTNAYVRVWRQEPGYEAGGEMLPAPPASVAMLLGKTQGRGGAVMAPANSKVAELVMDAAGMAVSGSKTIQVEVKE